jgi:hypothetical protein
MEQEIKERYEDLTKKYKLPPFNSLNNEFEISTIENKEFLLREIRRKIDEKIELYVKLLEGILQPDTSSLSDMYECSVFNDKEKDVIFKLFKKLLFFHRFSIETSVGEDDKRSVEFINDFWKDWSGIKDEFSDFVKKMKEEWIKENKIIDEERRYLG